MKKYCSIIIKPLLFIPLLVILGCEGTFVNDPIDPRLPKYTENGYDVAGAFINDQIWRSVVEISLFTTINEPSFISTPGSDSLAVRFSGEIKQDATPIDIAFYLNGINISTFNDLEKLNDKIITLDGSHNQGGVIYESLDYTNTKGGTGQIYFTKVEVTDSASATVSGTFGFNINDSIEVTYGRFDYRVTSSYFEINNQ